MEAIRNLVADKFAGCKDTEEAHMSIEEDGNMAKRKKKRVKTD